MLTIEPRCLLSAQEELRAVSARASVGHGEYARSSVAQGEVFIGELRSVDGFSSGAVEVREVTTLTHKIRNHAMETASLKV